jgi:hypothetical protein
MWAAVVGAERFGKRSFSLLSASSAFFFLSVQSV